MTKHAFLLLSAFFSLLPAFGQALLAQDDIGYKIHDFNLDDHQDSIAFYYDGGSGFGGHTADVFDGKSGRRFSMTSYHSFACFFAIIPVDDFFWKPENKGYLPFLQNVFAEDPAPDAGDGSLQWLIAAYLENPRPFNGQPLKSPLRWMDSFAPQEKTVFYALSNDTLRILDRHSRQENEDETGETTDAEEANPLGGPGKGWLLYYGHNHYQSDSFRDKYPKLVQAKGEDSLYVTKHGLLIKQAGRYAWLAAHDCGIFGGPDKLRYASIQNALWEGDFVYFDHRSPMEAFIAVYKVSLKTGEVSRIAGKGGLQNMEMSVKKGMLHLVYTGLDGKKTVKETGL